MTNCRTFLKEIQQEIKQMGKSDEKYRRILVYAKEGDKNTFSVDSLIHHPEAFKKRQLKKGMITKETVDTLWYYQDPIDSNNQLRLVEII